MATATLRPPKAKRRWTYDEMAAELPETNQPTELWDGELIMSPSPRPSHQRIVLRVARVIEDFADTDGVGEVFVSPLDVVLSSHHVVQPDVIFVANANASIVTETCLRGAPNLVVEVNSGTWRRDRVDTLYKLVTGPLPAELKIKRAAAHA